VRQVAREAADRFHSSADSASTGSAPRAAEPPPQASILIVEDEFLVALDIETALADAGFEIAGVARSAEEALELFRQRRPALIVMDIRLVGKRDGIDAALDIYRESGIRCIFASAHHDAATVARAGPAHPVGWLSKPYATSSLVRMVRDFLRSSGGNSPAAADQ